MDVFEEGVNTAKVDKSEFPWLVFKLHHGYFTFNSESVISIITMPEHVIPIPRSSRYIRGVFELRGEIIPLVELRNVFDMESLREEYHHFSDMLDQRKEDHLHWVKELQRCTTDGEPFTLATDPHKCAFGQWYYGFSTDLHSVNHHMKKIEEPHKKLHEAALEVMRCNQDCDHCQRNECLKNILEHLSAVLVPEVLSLLDEAKDVFKVSYREMVIVMELRGRHVGIIADEIISVEELNEVYDYDNISNNFVTEIRKSPTLQDNVMVVNEKALMDLIEGINL